MSKLERRASQFEQELLSRVRTAGEAVRDAERSLSLPALNNPAVRDPFVLGYVKTEYVHLHGQYATVCRALATLRAQQEQLRGFEQEAIEVLEEVLPALPSSELIAD